MSSGHRPGTARELPAELNRSAVTLDKSAEPRADRPRAGRQALLMKGLATSRSNSPYFFPGSLLRSL